MTVIHKCARQSQVRSSVTGDVSYGQTCNVISIGVAFGIMSKRTCDHGLIRSKYSMYCSHECTVGTIHFQILLLDFAAVASSLLTHLWVHYIRWLMHATWRRLRSYLQNL